MLYTCEFCGKSSETKSYGSGRFCSQSCACKFSARAKQQQKEAAKSTEKVDGGIKGQSYQVNKSSESQQKAVMQAYCVPEQVIREVTTVRIESNNGTVYTNCRKETSTSLEDKFNEVPRYLYKKPQRTREQMFKLRDMDMIERKQQIMDLYPVQSWVCTNEQLDRLISRLSEQRQ